MRNLIMHHHSWRQTNIKIESAGVRGGNKQAIMLKKWKGKQPSKYARNVKRTSCTAYTWASKNVNWTNVLISNQTDKTVNQTSEPTRKKPTRTSINQSGQQASKQANLAKTRTKPLGLQAIIQALALTKQASLQISKRASMQIKTT